MALELFRGGGQTFTGKWLILSLFILTGGKSWQNLRLDGGTPPSFVSTVPERAVMSWGKQGGRTRLPKFKFSTNFPVGLHVILQKQIKKNA